MKRTIDITDFSFTPSGHGHYKVTYYSPTLRWKWTTTTSCMQLIDATKNADEPKKKDLIHLKEICKQGEKQPN